MAVNAFSVGRDISVDITGSLPLDGYKALMAKIQEFENRVDDGDTLATIAPGSEIKLICYGKIPYAAYIFDLSANFTAGSYVLTFLEAVPNVESATVL